MSNRTFDFIESIKESKHTLVNPRYYFSTMKTTGGMTEPLIKAGIYGAMAGILAFLCSLLKICVSGNGMFGDAIGIMVFVWYIIASIAGLFIVSVIVMIISSVCKGNTGFEANLRVTAAVMVVVPVIAFLEFTDSINLYLGMIVRLAVNIFALWLLYNGLVEALKSNKETTKIVSLVIVAIFVLIMLLSLGARQ